MIFILLTILSLGILLLGVYVAMSADSLMGSEDFITSPLTTSKVADIIKRRQGNFYDLGSARGNFLFRLTKQVPQLKYFGLDDSQFRTQVAKFKNWIFGKKATFLHQNIFQADLSSADIAYIYLPQALMPALQNKLQKELKPGSLVITHSVSFPAWPPSEVHQLREDTAKIKKLFVYIKD